MSEVKLAELAKQLMPYLPIGEVTTVVQQQSGSGDHGLLTGLGDDDHTQYVLADGTRSFTGGVTIDTTVTLALLVKSNSGQTQIEIQNNNATHQSTLLFTEGATLRAFIATQGTGVGTWYFQNKMNAAHSRFYVTDVGATTKELLDLFCNATNQENIVLGSGTGGQTTVTIDGSAGYYRFLEFCSGGQVRWRLDANATAESGSNAGSDFEIHSYTDAGGHIRGNLTIRRSDGAVYVNHNFGYLINFTISDAYSYGYADLTVAQHVDGTPAGMFYGITGGGFEILVIKDYKGGSQWFKFTNDMGFEGTTYTKGISGFQINADGDAEFNNVSVRGSIRASVFEYGNIQATSGTLLVSKSATKINADWTSPASIDGSNSIALDNDAQGTPLVAVNDILRIKAMDSYGVAQVWLQVTSVSDQGDWSAVTVTLKSGDTSTVFRKGIAVACVGTTSGGGNIYLSSDGVVGASANISIAQHSGAPWTSDTLMVRLGNLNGSYGTGSNDRYGIGIGDYSAGNYLSWNAATANQLAVVSAGGKVRLGGQYAISIVAGSAYSLTQALNFKDSSENSIADLYLITSTANTLWLKMSPYNKQSDISLQSYANATYAAQILMATASGGGNFTGFEMRSDSDAGSPSTMTLVASTSITLMGYSATDTDVHVLGDLHNNAGDDIYSSDQWQNYGPYTTLGGWSLPTSYTNIYYKIVGKLIFVSFAISGTSNQNYAYFTVPHNSAAGNGFGFMYRAYPGSYTNGWAELPVSSSQVQLWSSVSKPLWPTTGTKFVAGTFWYERS